MSRPALLPGLRPMWRDRHTVQLGTDPEHAVVLELSHRSAARLLELLDGSRTERVLLTEMARLGMPAEDVREVLTALAERGLVLPAHTLMPAALPAEHRARLADEAAALALRRESPGSPARVLQRRGQARVIVAGSGATSRLIATALLDAGVGKVGTVTAPGAAAVLQGPSSTEAAGDGTRGSRPHAATLRATDATFRVQVGYAVSTRGTRRRVPHLALTVRDGVAVVGPLVPVTGGPCLHCLDLHRTDRDPSWPRLVAQLAQAPPGGDPCSAATRLTAAGFAAAEVLAYLDGAEPTTIGTTVEIDGVLPWRRRTWSPHPSCDCARRRRG
ncbi:thiamin biosynthesis protein [Catellatospora methionotrophica]|uniref:Thiamin biosynthesis protein n=2 Tax=Catellatospora methionotrophica TaxID=121620 RepID=A0A8J3LK08_9ACTN|nr:thiamin biosynthesis protein [Catellatospora methionotrophica]